MLKTARAQLAWKQKQKEITVIYIHLTAEGMCMESLASFLPTSAVGMEGPFASVAFCVLPGKTQAHLHTHYAATESPTGKAMNGATTKQAQGKNTLMLSEPRPFFLGGCFGQDEEALKFHKLSSVFG